MSCNVTTLAPHTHAPCHSDDRDTDEYKDAQAKGAVIVDEDWVRKRVTMLGAAGNGGMSFDPVDDFVQDLIATDQDEGEFDCEGGQE